MEENDISAYKTVDYRAAETKRTALKHFLDEPDPPWPDHLPDPAETERTVTLALSPDEAEALELAAKAWAHLLGGMNPIIPEGLQGERRQQEITDLIALATRIATASQGGGESTRPEVEDAIRDRIIFEDGSEVRVRVEGPAGLDNPQALEWYRQHLRAIMANADPKAPAE